VRAANAVGKMFKWDVSTFLTTYPVAAPLDAAAVKHFTTQQMGSLLTFQRNLKRVVITVHDIIPYLTRNDPGKSDYYHLVD
jgi:hypothetical protein